MPNRLLHTLIAVSTTAQSSQAAGYPGTNVITTAVDAQWRTTAAGGGEFVTLDLGSSKAIAGIAVNGCNWTGATVKADNNATPTTTRGTLTTYVDNNGRRKGCLEFSATARYIRIELPASNTDGASYFATGFAAPFAAAMDLPRDALFGSTIEHQTPKQTTQLANGQRRSVITGAVRSVVNLKFVPRAADDIEALRRYAEAGVVWLNLALAGQEYRQWPVQDNEPSARRTIEKPNREPVDLRLDEVC